MSRKHWSGKVDLGINIDLVAKYTLLATVSFGVGFLGMARLIEVLNG